VALLSTRFAFLDHIVLGLELAEALAACKDFLDNGPLPLLASQSRILSVGGSGDYGPCLAELRHQLLARILFKMLFSKGQDIAHSEYLQVSLELWCQVGLGEVEPIRASVGFRILSNVKVSKRLSKYQGQFVRATRVWSE
jgi:hypothetical protein